MSGICGICEVGARFSRAHIEPMLAQLAAAGGTDRCVTGGDSAILGAARHWDHQQVGEIGHVRVAVDADLLNTAELRGIVPAPASSLAELIAHLYIAHGTDFVSLLSGSFAIALWDSRERRLLLALDRLGINNLYFAVQGEQLLFASRSGAIMAAQPDAADIDRSALAQSLVLGSVPAPLSIYKGLERMRPGHVVTFADGVLKRECYWDIRYVEDNSRSERQWAGDVRDALRSAVHAATVECEPQKTGAYLSGGTDSSSVVAFLNEWYSPVKAFSIWFQDPRYSEAEFAYTTARTFHATHFERCLVPEDAAAVIPKIIAYYDEPFTNSSAIGGYYCAKLAREQGVDVLLAGDGGDELFGGNERYATDKIFQIYQWVPKFLRKAVIEPLSKLLPASSRPRRYVEGANTPHPRRMFRRTLLLNTDPEEVFSREFLGAAPPSTWLETAEEHVRRAVASTDLNRMLYLDVKITLADNDLRKVIGTAEMAGTRVRFPLVDHRLAEFSARIPTRLKLKGWEKRYIFKQAMTGILPEKVLYKAKHGFGVPLGIWLLQDPKLNEFMIDVLRDARTRQRGYFRPEFIDKLIDLQRTDHAKFYGEYIWYLLVIELWARQHLERRAAVEVGR